MLKCIIYNPMTINYLAVVVATVVQFVIGGAWYMSIFRHAWGEIHGFNSLSKEEQEKAQKGMGMQLGFQFLFTFITAFVFALLSGGFPPEWNVFGEAGFFWLGFVVPTQAAAVMFGGTEKKWMMKKIAIMAGGSLACLEAAATVFHFI